MHQRMRSVALARWRFIAGLSIVAAMLAYHFVGGAIGDGVDPCA